MNAPFRREMPEWKLSFFPRKRMSLPNEHKLTVKNKRAEVDHKIYGLWTHFVAPTQIPISDEYLGCGHKGLVFCRNNGWIMENMVKESTTPKWVLIVWPKLPLTPQNLSSLFVCPSPKILDFNEKRLIHSVTRLISGVILDIFHFNFRKLISA